jgi:hypothetical protein
MRVADIVQCGPDDHKGPRINGLTYHLGRSEWRSTRPAKRVSSRYSRAAKATFKRDRRLNIRISTKDLEAIQKGW